MYQYYLACALDMLKISGHARIVWMEIYFCTLYEKQILPILKVVVMTWSMKLHPRESWKWPFLPAQSLNKNIFKPNRMNLLISRFSWVAIIVNNLHSMSLHDDVAPTWEYIEDSSYESFDVFLGVADGAQSQSYNQQQQTHHHHRRGLPDRSWNIYIKQALMGIVESITFWWIPECKAEMMEWWYEVPM